MKAKVRNPFDVLGKDFPKKAAEFVKDMKKLDRPRYAYQDYVQPLVHVSPQVRGTPGEPIKNRTTMCGSKPTTHDWSVKDAERSLPLSLADWNVCKDCLAKIRRK